MKYLVTKMHYLLIVSLFKTSSLYLKYICSKSRVKLYKLEDIFSKIENYSHCDYCLFLDVKKYIRCSSLFKLLKKIFISQDFISFLCRLFEMDFLKKFKLYFNFGYNYFFLQKNRCTKLIIDLIILNFYYELFILLNNYLSINYSKPKILTIYNNDFLFFVCNDIYEYIELKRKIVDILLSKRRSAELSQVVTSKLLSKGIFMDFFLANVNDKYNFLDLIFIPSLKSQFLLMRQVSLLLMHSKSSPLFLFIIRLNMLILLWLDIYMNASMKKITYLLDYLINLKLRNIYKSAFSYKFLSLKLRKKIRDDKLLDLPKNHKHFFTTIYHEKYYRFYIILRLTWVYQLKFLINLREAI